MQSAIMHQRTVLCVRHLFTFARKQATAGAKACISSAANPLNFTQSTKFLHTSTQRYSLEEFFDNPKVYGARTIKSGRPWTMEDLRLKSNTDLHKLWFVLYKERNMLYTMQEAAKAEHEVFPSPERIDKVEQSMANLENVVRERNKAYWHLEVSPCATGERPRAFRRDVFGRPKWHTCSQHLVPYRNNAAFRLYNSPKSYNETSWFYNRYREMKRSEYNYHRSKKARHIRDLIRRFPNLDVDYVAEISPEFPPGYVKHLKDNIHLYKNDRYAAYFEASLKKSIKELNEKT